MIFHENRLLADDSHELSYLIYFENWKDFAKIVAAVVIGALRVNDLFFLNNYLYSVSIFFRHLAYVKKQFQWKSTNSNDFICCLYLYPVFRRNSLPRLCRGEIEHVHCIWVTSYFAYAQFRTSDNSEVFLHSLGL